MYRLILSLLILIVNLNFVGTAYATDFEDDGSDENAYEIDYPELSFDEEEEAKEKKESKKRKRELDAREIPKAKKLRSRSHAGHVDAIVDFILERALIHKTPRGDARLANGGKKAIFAQFSATKKIYIQASIDEAKHQYLTGRPKVAARTLNLAITQTLPLVRTEPKDRTALVHPNNIGIDRGKR